MSDEETSMRSLAPFETATSSFTAPQAKDSCCQPESHTVTMEDGTLHSYSVVSSTSTLANELITGGSEGVASMEAIPSSVQAHAHEGPNNPEITVSDTFLSTNVFQGWPHVSHEHMDNPTPADAITVPLQPCSTAYGDTTVNRAATDNASVLPEVPPLSDVWKRGTEETLRSSPLMGCEQGESALQLQSILISTSSPRSVEQRSGSPVQRVRLLLGNEGEDSEWSNPKPEGAATATRNPLHTTGSEAGPLDSVPPNPCFGHGSFTKKSVLTLFTPIVQQHDYRKTDIKVISSACPRSFYGDVRALYVSLKIIPDDLLKRLDCSQKCMRKVLQAGRPDVTLLRASLHSPHRGKSKPKELSSSHMVDSNKLIEPITGHDFANATGPYDSVLLAVSFSLWGSVLYHNELVTAAEEYFLTGRSSERSATSKKARKLSFCALMRWLNEYGVDVLVFSEDRCAAASFCARRCHLQRNRVDEILGNVPKQRSGPNAEKVSNAELDTSAEFQESVETLYGETHGATVGTEETGRGVDNRMEVDHPTCSKPMAHSRVLAVVEYDSTTTKWRPLTTARPIRLVAASLHHQRRKQMRNESRRCRRRLREQAEANTKASVERAINKKRLAWEAKKAALEAAAEENRCQQHHDDGGSSEVSGASLRLWDHDRQPPFQSMQYPTIVQTDMGILDVLRQSLHPVLVRTRIRLLLVCPLGLIATVIGITLIVLLGARLTTCCFSAIHDSCLSAEEIDDEGPLPSTCPSHFCRMPHGSSTSSRFLYGSPLNVGNALIVSICFLFAATVTGVIVVFFTTRFLALKNARARFQYVVHGLHILWSAIALAFAFYAMSIVVRPYSSLSCDDLAQAYRPLCEATTKDCPGYSFRVFTHTPRRKASFVLAITYAVLCVLHFMVSFIPALPSPAVRRKLPHATPHTLVFRPSSYAPDGMTRQQCYNLQEQVIRPRVQLHLQQHTMGKEPLMATAASIGEMMQCNREQSVRRVWRTHTLRHQGLQQGQGSWARPWRQAPRHYAVMSNRMHVASATTLPDTQSTGSEYSTDSASDELPPRLQLRVEQIGRLVKRRNNRRPSHKVSLGSGEALRESSQKLNLLPAVAYRAPLSLSITESAVGYSQRESDCTRRLPSNDNLESVAEIVWERSTDSPPVISSWTHSARTAAPSSSIHHDGPQRTADSPPPHLTEGGSPTSPLRVNMERPLLTQVSDNIDQSDYSRRHLPTSPRAPGSVKDPGRQTEVRDERIIRIVQRITGEMML